MCILFLSNNKIVQGAVALHRDTQSHQPPLVKRQQNADIKKIPVFEFEALGKTR
jgi:hypothetical protein